MSLYLWSAVLTLAGPPIAAQQPPEGVSPDRGSGRLPGPGQTAEVDPFVQGAQLEREHLIGAVLERNPGLEAARQAWRAALERYPQAVSLGDPMVGYGLAPLSLGSRDVRYGQEARFGQLVPFPGKLKLRGQVAQAEAEAAQWDYETARLELATLASLLFDDYYVVHRALEINAEHLRLLGEFQRIATAQYVAGTAAQQDPLQAEVEVAHLLHREVVLDTEREVLVARLNALLHRRPGAPLPPPPAELLPASDPLAPVESLEEDAVAVRPELRTLAAEIRGLGAAVALQKREFYPDFEPMTSYNSMWGDSEHRFMVGLEVNLPIRRSRRRAAVAEAEARLAQAVSERQRMEDEVRSEVRQAYVRDREARHIVELYESRLLPASHDQIRAALAGFKTARNSFLALIEAERNERQVQLRYHEVLADLYRSGAELERAMGRMPGMAVVAGDGPEGAAPRQRGKSQ